MFAHNCCSNLTHSPIFANEHALPGHKQFAGWEPRSTTMLPEHHNASPSCVHFESGPPRALAHPNLASDNEQDDHATYGHLMAHHYDEFIQMLFVVVGHAFSSQCACLSASAGLATLD
jgi:hypothetical protein